MNGLMRCGVAELTPPKSAVLLLAHPAVSLGIKIAFPSGRPAGAHLAVLVGLAGVHDHAAKLTSEAHRIDRAVEVDPACCRLAGRPTHAGRRRVTKSALCDRAEVPDRLTI